jgi:hypothetical protein
MLNVRFSLDLTAVFAKHANVVVAYIWPFLCGEFTFIHRNEERLLTVVPSMCSKL